MMNKTEKNGRWIILIGIALIAIPFFVVLHSKVFVLVLLVVGFCTLLTGIITARIGEDQSMYQERKSKAEEFNNKHFCHDCAEFMNKNKLAVKRV